MKITLPRPEHLSYKKHRYQVRTQIILPLLLASLFIAGLVYVIVKITVTEGGGDVTRWAAIATIWISLPVLLLGAFVFVLLAGIIYVLALITGILPEYTGKAQLITYKARTYVKRAADLTVRPVLIVEGLAASVRAFFGRK